MDMIFRALLTGAALLGLAASAEAGAYLTPRSDGVAVPHIKKVHATPQRSSKFCGECKDCCGAYRVIYAESWYGFERVIAPVRRAEHGDQVRLPGGSWVYCEFSCEYTLKRQSLDFWQGQGAGGDGDQSSPGYFSFNLYPNGAIERRP
ncbi:hypothetical protein T281_06995 [Rhodomicrobium udaipurense JA643]|nr:hypothetical protein T281_06995 [Rhodomicrobium udaipurense JA643]